MPKQPTQESAENRFKRLIPKTQDCTVILLKGHLLIEEQMEALVEALVKDARPLGDARLTFYQWLCIGMALFPDSTGGDHWRFVAQLNQTRNKLAHNPEVADLEQKVDALIKLYAEDEFTRSKTPQERATRLRTTLAFVCGILNGRNLVISEMIKKE